MGGRGFMRYDYDTYGVPWDEGQERTLEILEILKAAWTQRPFSFQGKHWQFENVEVWPKPAQEPHPPIWGAASRAPESFAWWGAHNYNLLTVVYLHPLEHLAELLGHYRRAAAEAGHDPAKLQVVTHFQVYCHEDGKEARREAEGAVRNYIEQSNEARAQGTAQAVLKAAEFPYDKLIDEGRLCVGTPDECAAILTRARDTLGLAGVDCTFYFGGIEYTKARRSFELFAREVMPRFREPSEARTVA
jgi:alkanesulfonate monooxygenase SsuD/methylene tetrahydromethanopterin reductase-like flavin-dependent oxidoreductase (luciferase family)